MRLTIDGEEIFINRTRTMRVEMATILDKESSRRRLDGDERQCDMRQSQSLRVHTEPWRADLLSCYKPDVNPAPMTYG